VTRTMAVTAVGCAILFLGCPHPRPPVENGHDVGQMEELGDHLLYLTAKVQASAAEGTLPDGPDKERIAFATRDDPPVMTPFEGYRVRVARDGENAAVLVCTRDGKTALLEDLGCTARLDVEHWRSPSPPACAFTSNLHDACAGR